MIHTMSNMCKFNRFADQQFDQNEGVSTSVMNIRPRTIQQLKLPSASKDARCKV